MTLGLKFAILGMNWLPLPLIKLASGEASMFSLKRRITSIIENIIAEIGITCKRMK
jgi:hypothetical protein